MRYLSLYFSLLVACYVIFNRYTSPIPQITLAEFFMLLFWMVFVLFRPKKVNIEWCLIPWCIYLIGYVLLPFTGFVSITGAFVDYVGTAARLLFIYLSIAVLGKNLFSIEDGVKFIRITAIGVAVYACIQVIAAQFGIYLTTYLPFLTPMLDFNVDEFITHRGLIYSDFRACSIFQEPAHLAVYLAFAVTIELFKTNHPISYKTALFLSAICLLSLSSTGFTSILFVWTLFFLQRKKLSLKQFSIGVILSILGIIIVTFAIYWSGIWTYFFNRTFRDGLGNSTRFYAIQDMFLASDSLTGMLFGQGLAETENYLPGFAATYLGLGAIGLLLVISFLTVIYRRGMSLQRNLTLLFILLNTGTVLLLGGASIPFLCVMIPRPLNTNPDYKVALK